jgi:hypothetical protein
MMTLSKVEKLSVDSLLEVTARPAVTDPVISTSLIEMSVQIDAFRRWVASEGDACGGSIEKSRDLKFGKSKFKALPPVEQRQASK